MARKRRRIFNSQSFLTRPGPGKKFLTCPKNYTIFSQGEKGEAVFYVQTGKVKLTVVSTQGKEAVVAAHLQGAHPKLTLSVGGHLRRRKSKTTRLAQLNLFTAEDF